MSETPETTEAAEPAGDTKTVKVAKYLGPTQHTRIIEAKQFNEEYFSNMKKDLVWDASNRWMVNVSEATPEMLEYLESDPDFSIEDHEMAADEEEAAPEAPAAPEAAPQEAPQAEPTEAAPQEVPVDTQTELTQAQTPPA